MQLLNSNNKKQPMLLTTKW